MLARGDRRDFVIIDQAGQVHSLGRQIHGVKAAELREFMKGIDPQTLPTVEQAKGTQKELLEQAKAQVSSGPATKTPELAPDPVQAQRKAEIEALRNAVADRHGEETRRLVESHSAQLGQLRHTLDVETRDKLDRLDALHRDQAEAQRRRHELEQAQAGITDFIKDLFSPARVAQRDADRQREEAQLAERQKQERDGYAATLQQTRELEIENLTERQGQQLRDRATSNEEDLERYIREQEVARQLQAELEERERQLEEERTRDGPERPPPRSL